MRKNKVPKFWSKRNLSFDIWSEILSNLPARSLLRFRTVSKSWRAIIDDPEFARSHLTRFKNNRSETHLFVSQAKGGLPECVLRRSKKYTTISTRFGYLKSSTDAGTFGSLPALRDCPVRDWKVHSSTDGVVILKDSFSSSQHQIGTIMLWNPSIRKTRVLPPSPQTPSRDKKNYDAGLGFDPSIKDYKIVKFVRDTDNSVGVYVYTIGSNSWKTIQLHGKGYEWLHSLFPQSSIYLKGVLYMIARYWNSHAKCLVSFDLSTEVFAWTEFPDLRVDDDPFAVISNVALTLVDGGCSFGIFGFCRVVNQGSLWVAESSGAEIKTMTWTKRYTLCSKIPTSYRVKFLCLKKNGDMFLNLSKLVTCYDSETHDERIVRSSNGFTFTDTMHVYMESLILLN